MRNRLEPMQAEMESELGRLREQGEYETRRVKQIIERLQQRHSIRWLHPAHHHSIADQQAIPSRCSLYLVMRVTLQHGYQLFPKS
jgi:hypothetical protein